MATEDTRDPQVIDPGVRWQRLVLGAAGATLVIVVYTLLNRWNAARFGSHVDPWSLSTPLDQRLPIEPWAIWPYLLYYPLCLTPLALARTRRELARILVAFAAATALAWVSWVVWPVQMIYPHLTCGGVSCGLVEHMQRIDHGTNIFPSLHASHSMLVVAIFLHYRHRYWRLVALVAAAVVTAAVLVGQHYVIDVLVGLALGIWAWKFAEKVVAARPRVRTRG